MARFFRDFEGLNERGDAWTPERLTQVQKQSGELLKLQRMRRRLSQERLALAVGITFQQVQKYENGLNGMRASRVIQFCDLLQCDYAALLGPLNLADNATLPESEAKQGEPYSMPWMNAEIRAMIAVMEALGSQKKRAAMVKAMRGVADILGQTADREIR